MRSDYFMYPLGLAVWLLLTAPGRLGAAGQVAGPDSVAVTHAAAPASPATLANAADMSRADG